MENRDYDVIEIDLVLLLKALWHKAWLIILVTAIFFAAGFFYSNKFITPKYTASCMIYVNNTYAEYNPDYAIQNSELTAAQSLVDTYIVILETPSTLKEIKEKSGLNYSTEELKQMIKAEAENETEIFRAKVTTPVPYESIKIANTITEVLPKRISNVVDGSSVRTVQKAYQAPKTSPARKKWALFCGLLGFLLICLNIIISELKDDNIYDEDYIYNVVDDIPILASIPDLMDTKAFAKNYYYGRGYGYTKQLEKKQSKREQRKEKKERKKVSDIQRERMILCDKLDFTASEAYKVLRTNLVHHLDELGEGSKVIGITSADRQEGKSTASINLSYVFSQTNNRVLTIEGDLRIPAIAKRMKIKNEEGLTDVINAKPSKNMIASKIRESKVADNWKIMTSGSKTKNPSELLSDDRLGKVLTELKKDFDIIIIDLPPVNEVTDAMAIAPFVDGMIFVVKQSYTKKMPFNMALHQLQLAGAPLTGFVMTNSNGVGGKYDRYAKYGKYGKYGRYRKYSGYNRYGKYYSPYNRYDRYGRYDRYDAYGPENNTDDIPKR